MGGRLMPRQARMLSESGIYHVTFRGVDKMDIFRDNADKSWFLTLLINKKAKGEFLLHAYCLMSNHVHLLVRAKDPLQRIIKRICGPYAQYFNFKYDRVGHLFQGRYHSQVIDCERHFLVCSRYIHLNPVAAGITVCAQDYPWSSYRIYSAPLRPSSLVDKEFLNSILSSDRTDAAKAFIAFTDAEVEEGEDYSFLEPGEKDNPRIKVEEILASFGLSSKTFRTAPSQLRRQVLSVVLANVDISGRELGKMLNISRTVIYDLKK
ncbi:MAG TPA: hypothetical protein DG577_05085 [Firmicutes bacterium]|jgi:REP element-mobilizing transposase RayT|nr:hypothetical protein [Bacillota bacterium]HBS92782.1 hypothetical protein [Bacillota bacterium]HCX78767.1 hypothetical protein [Bacillota bacterium]